MSILVVTSDGDAARSLCSALSRSGQRALWASTAEQAHAELEGELPLVLVADTELESRRALIDRLRMEAPWTRVLLIGGEATSRDGDTQVVPKPFDASELAALLARESQVANLARSQRHELTRGLEHAERLAAIGRIAAGMAHEINNPLAVIRASASYIAQIAQQSTDAELSACASDIELAVDRIGSFVQHVCGFARRERPQMTDAPVQTAIDIALRMVRPRLTDKNVRISVEPCGGIHVPHDPPRLAQAVLNVLSNAVDAAACGGGNVAMRVRVLDANVRIEVDDDGPGISPDLARTAFEPFTTTKPFGQGTGLGLAITRQIVMDHHGDVTLEPRAEGGARVVLSLPRFTPGVYKLLVIDDDPAVRRALATDLRREGFDVVSARSFSEARQALHEQLIHVIITDWQLPDLGGTELVSAICVESPTSRLVVMSADPASLPREDADETLCKPWDRARLCQIVRELCLKGERSPSQKPPAKSAVV